MLVGYLNFLNMFLLVFPYYFPVISSKNWNQLQSNYICPMYVVEIMNLNNYFRVFFFLKIYKALSTSKFNLVLKQVLFGFWPGTTNIFAPFDVSNLFTKNSLINQTHLIQNPSPSVNYCNFGVGVFIQNASLFYLKISYFSILIKPNFH